MLTRSSCTRTLCPRPDLAASQIQYRGIHALAIRMDYNCDSPRILQMLQERFPESGLSVDSDDGKGPERAVGIGT